MLYIEGVDETVYIKFRDVLSYTEDICRKPSTIPTSEQDATRYGGRRKVV